MLYIILGKLGSGKTLFLTYLATKIKTKKIYSNYKLHLKNYRELKAIDLIKLPNNVEVFLDEGYTWIESRISSSLLNRYMTYLLFQSRKRGNNFFITAQSLSSIDKRYRNHSDVIVFCESKKNLGFKYSILNKETYRLKKYTLPLKEAKKIFKLYDTTEVIEPFGNSRLKYNIIKDDTKELMKRSNVIAKEIKPKLNRITHNTVKLAIMNEGLDKNFEPIVYAILKSDLEFNKK